MRILVTGASGFVGTRLCSVLEAQGHDLIRAGRAGSAPSCIGVGDVGPDTDWRPALANREVVVHLAARVHVMRDAAADPLQEFRRVNVDATLNLARQAVAAGVGRFVFVSSIKVNGESTPPAEPYREDDPAAPQDAYAVSKHEAESGLMRMAQSADLEIVIVRPPLVYGPGVKGNFAALEKLVRRGVPLPLDALRNRRSLVALDNLVDFISVCADRKRSPQAGGHVFLISDGLDLSTPDLLRKLARAHGRQACLFPVPESWLRAAAAMLGKSAQADRLLGSLVVDISKARDMLGWRPVVGIDQQLEKMVRDAATP